MSTFFQYIHPPTHFPYILPLPLVQIPAFFKDGISTAYFMWRSPGETENLAQENKEAMQERGLGAGKSRGVMHWGDGLALGERQFITSLEEIGV
jgi:hypothetical protein